MALAALGQALGWVGVAVTGNASVCAVMLIVGGGCGSLCSVVIGSVRQALTPDHLMGRVVAAYRFFGLGAAALGALSGGLIAGGHNLTAPLLVAAAMLVAVTVILRPMRHRLAPCTRSR
jgi:hypothetical protein